MRLLLNIVVGKKRIRPLARNLLRTIALQVDFDLEISSADKEEIFVSGGEVYPLAATESLMKELSALEADIPLPEAFKTQMALLLSWLEAQTVGGETDDIFSLEELLEEVRRQSVFYTAGEPGKKFSGFWRKWREKYPYPQDFRVTGKSVINEINRQEAGDYLKAHKESDGASYIENAGKSLLAAIPNDVESILDIGSGPGYIDRLIPADYAVLAMDIDEKILAGNPRPTCVGDVMDIPLPDRSVDFVMASDVIEHLPEDVLRAGMKEMERVSRKYLYLQVPFMEDPLMAYAYCPQCGHVWHVNHHKRFFDQGKLCSLASNEWKPVLVNYTGDVFFHRSGLMEAKLAETFGWEIYGVENAICPQCGASSACRGMEHWKDLERMTDFDVECPFPAYTEIGVLFCRAEQEAQLANNGSASFSGCRRRNAISIAEGLEVKASYSRKDLLPGLYVGDCRMEREVKAYCFKKNDGVLQAWGGVAFPMLPGSYSGVEFEGALAQPGTVRLIMLTDDGKEREVDKWQWDGEKRQYRFELLQGTQGKPLYFKLYFEASELLLFSCQLLGDKDFLYDWYSGEDFGFLCFEEENTKYQLILPDAEGLPLSYRPQKWLELTNSISARISKTLEKLCTGAEQSLDARIFIKKSILAEEHIALSDVKPLPDRRELILESIWAENQDHIALSDVKPLPDGRDLILESIWAEKHVELYRKNKITHCRYFSETLLRCLQRMENWIHRHQKIYDFLASLGVKNFYMRCKGRMIK